jgi:hypothetical protein
MRRVTDEDLAALTDDERAELKSLEELWERASDDVQDAFRLNLVKAVAQRMTAADLAATSAGNS